MNFTDLTSTFGTGVRVDQEQYRPRPAECRTLLIKFTSPNGWQSGSLVYVQHGDEVSTSEVQADCRQTGNGLMQFSEKEARSGYWGRDKEKWSGAEGRSGIQEIDNRKFVRE